MKKYLGQFESEGSERKNLLSKTDFLHVVEMMAGDLTAAFDADDLQTVYMSCPYDTWKQTFGEPRDIQKYHVASHSPVRAWEQLCSDGVVHCVGHFVGEPQDGQRIILTRVCLF